MVAARRALLSVTDKEGLVDFARGLRELDFELLATEGTGKTLRDAGIDVTTIAAYTGLKEGLGGRVKTLHPRIFAGILAPRGDEPDLGDLGAKAIDLVVANLYAFESVVAKPDVNHAEAVEKIDIGGPSLIRAAAKNASRVAVVVKPSRYPEVLRALREQGTVPAKLREDLALEAFEYTSRYDTAIFRYLADRRGQVLPPALRIAYEKVANLRYGENPYQKAALYREPYPYASAAGAEKLQGKELSYNNLLDLDSALRIATAFERTAAVVIKHTNPCGIALGDSLAKAYRAAHASDPISAYGGVVGLNRTVDLATAKAMRPHVLDAVIAPGYDADALETLKEKKKGAFLILRTVGEFRADHGVDMVRILGGILLQTTGFPEVRPETFRVVTKARPTQEHLRDILFGIQASRFVRSNSIVLVQGERTVGIGAGQMSRVDSCRIACFKAGDRARGSVAVSDAYFPFRDGLDTLATAGVSVVAHPGGSIRDDEVLRAADEHGIAMVLTGLRLFKH
ncbi:MAG: bifunctional phosphoribosylaminoimidazolecarboxamide formyltransferase/IMP cyclohydrolase [Euryarchaeota archaeon RBG_16_68_13]|nr:MAG: bifunctional phosphoribosylaminoimidazolecarboxamide formyltransferase/IMP cyclohydrolase [Euryarchaeota archaeon RBG_16_68_13]